MAILKVVLPGGEIRLLELGREDVTIGRGEGNTVSLDDPSASRWHAVVTATDSGYGVRDLGSTNGTMVGGVKITDAALGHGDTIIIGDAVLVFLDPGRGAVTRSPAPVDRQAAPAETPTATPDAGAQQLPAPFRRVPDGLVSGHMTSVGSPKPIISPPREPRSDPASSAPVTARIPVVPPPPEGIAAPEESLAPRPQPPEELDFDGPPSAPEGSPLAGGESLPELDSLILKHGGSEPSHPPSPEEEGLDAFPRPMPEHDEADGAVSGSSDRWSMAEHEPPMVDEAPGPPPADCQPPPIVEEPQDPPPADWQPPPVVGETPDPPPAELQPQPLVEDLGPPPAPEEAAPDPPRDLSFTAPLPGMQPSPDAPVPPPVLSQAPVTGGVATDAPPRWAVESWAPPFVVALWRLNLLAVGVKIITFLVNAGFVVAILAIVAGAVASADDAGLVAVLGAVVSLIFLVIAFAWMRVVPDLLSVIISIERHSRPPVPAATRVRYVFLHIAHVMLRLTALVIPLGIVLLMLDLTRVSAFFGVNVGGPAQWALLRQLPWYILLPVLVIGGALRMFILWMGSDALATIERIERNLRAMAIGETSGGSAYVGLVKVIVGVGWAAVLVTAGVLLVAPQAVGRVVERLALDSLLHDAPLLAAQLDALLAQITDPTGAILFALKWVIVLGMVANAAALLFDVARHTGRGVVERVRARYYALRTMIVLNHIQSVVIALGCFALGVIYAVTFEDPIGLGVAVLLACIVYLVFSFVAAAAGRLVAIEANLRARADEEVTVVPGRYFGLRFLSGVLNVIAFLGALILFCAPAIAALIYADEGWPLLAIPLAAIPAWLFWVFYAALPQLVQVILSIEAHVRAGASEKA